MPLGALFFEDVPLVEVIYLVFTRTPGGVTIGDSGFCCFVPCLSSAIISLRLLIGSLHGSGMSHATTASQKPSFRAPWRVSDAMIGRGSAGWTTSKSGHP